MARLAHAAPSWRVPNLRSNPVGAMSAAKASGFLLVSLSKTPRLAVRVFAPAVIRRGVSDQGSRRSARCGLGPCQRILQDYLNIMRDLTFASHEAALLAADDRAILHGTSRWSSEGR